MYLITTWISKISNVLINLFKLGSGNTWPGHLALKIFPGILNTNKLQPSKGFILITGTNGKTTTSKLISYILKKNNYKVVTNKSGANLLNGIVSALLLNTNFFGKPCYDIGVFEVDEFALVPLLKEITPEILVLLNLSRDQLDRYGETDIIYDKWKEILSMNKNIFVMADSSQEIFSDLKELLGNNILFFEKEDSIPPRVGLMGEFNKKNLGAALAVCERLGISNETALDSLAGFDAAYGRGEVLLYKNNKYRIFLAKNPASFNNNLDLLLNYPASVDKILIILNDNIPDGRDVSWIYDIDSKKLLENIKSKDIYISGTRAYDMAVRLSYAGIDKKSLLVDPDLISIVKKLSIEKEANEIVCFPNYSSMLDLRKVLTGKRIL